MKPVDHFFVKIIKGWSAGIRICNQVNSVTELFVLNCIKWGYLKVFKELFMNVKIIDVNKCSWFYWITLELSICAPSFTSTLLFTFWLFQQNPSICYWNNFFWGVSDIRSNYHYKYPHFYWTRLWITKVSSVFFSNFTVVQNLRIW